MENIFLVLAAVFAFLLTFFSLYTFWGMVRTKVPFVPTPKKIVKKMVSLAEVSADKNIYELGSGSGQILFAAEKISGKNRGKWVGFELIRPLVWFSKFRNWIRNGNIEFQCKNFFTADISNADIVFAYLWPSVMEEFYTKKYPELKKGTRIISNTFSIKGLQPVKVETLGKTKVFVYEK